MFSALHLIGSYNQYLGRTTGSPMGLASGDLDLEGGGLAGLPPPFLLPPPGYSYPLAFQHPPSEVKSALRRVGSPRRVRSEKKPIPEEQKDEKYYERRKRNNQAAKKSRDARRIREDHIALRASMLEHENAVLRAQVITLREEAHSLRQLLLHHKTTETVGLSQIQNRLEGGANSAPSLRPPL